MDQQQGTFYRCGSVRTLLQLGALCFLGWEHRVVDKVRPQLQGMCTERLLQRRRQLGWRGDRTSTQSGAAGAFAPVG